jgi:hypothetical protein
MGMFSFKCKGCGGELCEGELVRLGGRVQEYDGYGGDLDDYDSPCWHEACYQRATTEEKLDETASEPADNQGFGPAKLEFKAGYDPSLPVTEVEVLVYQGKGNEPWYLTESGLESQGEWLVKVEEFNTRPENNDFYDRLGDWPVSEMPKLHAEHQEKMTAAIGESPEARGLRFATLDEALDAVRPHLNAVENYSIHAFAKNGDLEGAILEMTHYERIEWIDGHKDYKRTGEFQDRFAYRYKGL